MTQAILAFYSQNLWSKQYPRQTQRTLHWILQIVGSSAAIIGMIIEFIGRSQKGKSHFKSIHSLFGLTAGILAVISMLGGVSALWSFEIRKYVRPIYFKLAHNLNGITAFVLGKSSHQSKKLFLLETGWDLLYFFVVLSTTGMVSLYLGYDKNYMIKNSREDIRMWLQAIAIITIILTLIGALRSALNFIRILFTN